MVLPLAVLVAYLLFCILVGLCGSQRRMGFTGTFLLSLAITPVIGLLVLLIDIAKGMIAVWWLPTAMLPGIDIDAGVSREWLTMACGFAVIVGHVYPVWFDFRGGKGAATVIGVVAAMELRLLAPLLLTWIVVLLLFGYVGLATMLSTIALTAAVLVLEPNNIPLCTFCTVVAAFVIFTHRSNIRRMRAGKENRVRRLWLFRSQRT